MDNQILEKSTKIVDKAYVENWKGELFCIIKDYFEASGDEASTPGAVLLDMMNCTGTPGYLLIVHETQGKPDGFLVGKRVGKVARILLAFLGKGLENKAIIREGLELFDGWAKENGCIASDLYTHRHPKSYKSLEQYGWTHTYTIYRKNYGGDVS